MLCSFAGMAIGQGVRTRMKPEVFRRWFLIAMILLGIYLAGSAIYNLIWWPYDSNIRKAAAEKGCEG